MEIKINILDILTSNLKHDELLKIAGELITWVAIERNDSKLDKISDDLTEYKLQYNFINIER